MECAVKLVKVELGVFAKAIKQGMERKGGKEKKNSFLSWGRLKGGLQYIRDIHGLFVVKVSMFLVATHDYTNTKAQPGLGSSNGATIIALVHIKNIGDFRGDRQHFLCFFYFFYSGGRSSSFFFRKCHLEYSMAAE